MLLSFKFRFLVLFTVWSLFTFAIPMVLRAQDTRVEMEDALDANRVEGLSKIYVIVSPLGLPPFTSYSSLNYATEIRKLASDRVEIVNTLANEMPQPRDAFPMGNIPSLPDMRYLQPSPKIESNDPRIAALAADIIKDLDAPNAKDVVTAVLLWNRRHLTWGNPNEVPSAIESLDNRVVNCIGFTHLPAALLRQLGIPARTVRTFIARPDQNRLTPHYLLEVYYPSLGGWVTYEPQGPGVPFIENIVLYTHHDWDVQGQSTFRGLARDLNVTVSGGVDANIPNPDLSAPELIGLSFSPSHFDPAQGHQQVEISLRARDEGSGIAEIWMDMVSPQFSGPRMSMTFNLQEGNAFEGEFSSSLGWDLQSRSHATEYRVSRMRLTDSLGNVREVQAHHLEEMGLPTGVTMATWDGVDSYPPELVFISPFFPDRITPSPDGFYHALSYSVATTATAATGSISFDLDYVHAEGTRTRVGGIGSLRVGPYHVAIHQQRYPVAHFPEGSYHMTAMYLRGPNSISYNILPQNFDRELMDYSFELASETPIYSGPPEIESIVIIAPEGDHFLGNDGLIIVETSGGIAYYERSEGGTFPAFRVFYKTLDGRKITNRRSNCNNRFGSHHLLFRPNGPRDTPVHIERIELDDKEGKTHTFYAKDFQDRIQPFIPERMRLQD